MEKKQMDRRLCPRRIPDYSASIVIDASTEIPCTIQNASLVGFKVKVCKDVRLTGDLYTLMIPFLEKKFYVKVKPVWALTSGDCKELGLVINEYSSLWVHQLGKILKTL